MDLMRFRYFRLPGVLESSSDSIWEPGAFPAEMDARLKESPPEAAPEVSVLTSGLVGVEGGTLPTIDEIPVARLGLPSLEEELESTPAIYAELTLVQRKRECHLRGLDEAGSGAVCVRRLRDDDRATGRDPHLDPRTVSGS